MAAGSISTPLVSALVTAFNHERFIGPAIDGLLSQTYRNMEIIVADDGSSDATVDIVRSYQNSGVVLVQTNRTGPSGAMNLAMSRARGEIFLLQSGDDLSGPTRATRQVSILRDEDLSACLPCLIDDEGHAVPDERFAPFYRMASPHNRLGLFSALLRDGNFLCASSVAMRRNVWETLGGFHHGLLQLQDYDYWLRALAAGYSMSIDPDRMISYRLHEHNLSDLRHDVRTQRELATLLRKLAPNLPEDLLVEAIYAGAYKDRSWSDTELQFLRALFFLRHESELVRQIGVDLLIELADAPDYDETIQTTFAVNRQAIFRALLYS